MTSASSNLDAIFHPRSVAIVGISLSRSDHPARDVLDALVEFKFSPIYLINPSGGEVMGLKVYRSLDEVPGTVDYVMSFLPVQMASRLVEDCARKGTKAVQFFTSGFSEIGEEGAKLEAELVQTARRLGIRIIGPNCLGIYCPKGRLSLMPHYPKVSGSVGLICQSGGTTVDLVNYVMWRGVRFSKVISYGNGSELDETDLLEYLADDVDTKIIALYLEGIKGGKRFRQAWEKATGEKTVILLKAGVTEAGAQAARSHTASLAGSDIVWDSLCWQSGAIRVHSVDELADMLVTCYFMPYLAGNRAALIGAGGGANVLMTDDFETKGIRVPQFPDEVKNRIRGFTPLAGNILRNPVDFSQAVYEPEKQLRAIKVVSEWEGIDFLVAFLRTVYYRIATSEGRRRWYHQLADITLEAAKSISKPVAVVIEPSIVPGEAAEVFKVVQKFAAAGIPVYYSRVSVAKALSLYLNSRANNRKFVK